MRLRQRCSQNFRRGIVILPVHHVFNRYSVRVQGFQAAEASPYTGNSRVLQKFFEQPIMITPKRNEFRRERVVRQAFNYRSGTWATVNVISNRDCQTTSDWEFL